MAKIIIAGQWHGSLKDYIKTGKYYQKVDVIFWEDRDERPEIKTVLYQFFFSCGIWIEKKCQNFLRRNFPAQDFCGKPEHNVDMPFPETYNSLRPTSRLTLFLLPFMSSILLSIQWYFFPPLLIPTIFYLILLVAFIYLFTSFLFFMLVVLFTVDKRNEFTAGRIDEILKRQGYKVGLISPGKLHTIDIKWLGLKSLGSRLKEKGHIIEVI